MKFQRPTTKPPAKLSPQPRRRDEARAAEVWAKLEAMPGFNEGVAEGRRQLAAGQRVPFHPDADPLDVTPEDKNGVLIDGVWHFPTYTEVIDLGPDPLPRFREQRRRSRWGCSIALVAIVAALVVFWTTVGFVAVNVFAAPRSGVQPAEAPVRSSQQVAPVTAGLLTGASHASVRLEHGVTPVSGGAPMPAAASQPAGSPPVSVPAPLSTLTYTGKLGYALPSYGSRYLAIRWPRGTIATLCGPAGCVTRTSTDFGPVRSLWEKGRLADLSAVDWQRVCGQPLRFGLCQGTLLIVSRPRALPDTSTEEGP